MSKQLKITVLKRDLYQDLVDEYAADKTTAHCSLFEDGQVFILDSLDMPEKFCSWAWADIHRDVVSVFQGASFPWINQENTIISCCTDGFRPVTFKIERIGK